MKQNQVPSPLTKGVAKVPVIMQMQMLECGAASLCMVLAYYHKWVPLEKVSLDCGVSRDGSNAKNISAAAKSYGLEVHAYRMEPKDFKEFGSYPCIIHWEFNHFVVLDGFVGNQAVINDPASGRRSVSMEQFDASFTGVCLQFKPTAQFVPDGKPKNIFQYTVERLGKSREAVIFVVVSALCAAMIGLIEPAFSLVFYDKLLTRVNPGWIRPFFVCYGVIILVRLLLEWMQAKYKVSISHKLNVSGNSSYMWHVLRLPMVFFSQRLAGDVVGRKSSSGNLEDTMLDTVAPMMLNGVAMLIYLGVMIRKNATLALIGFGAMLLSLLINRLVSAQRVNLSKVQSRDEGAAVSIVLSGIEAIETIKSSGAENGFFQKWAGYQASLNRQEVRMSKLNHYLGTIPLLVNQLCEAAVLLIGVRLMIEGSFTMGALTAFQSLLASFVAPANALVDADKTMQDMRVTLERVEDVMSYPVDPVMEAQEKAAKETPKEYTKLTGSLELRNVSFGYNPLGEPLIRDFNVSLKPGSRVAFVGASGCGKSTLAKLITGLYQPWSGEILFDGKPIQQINRDVFTASVAMVEQEIVLFEDTIANNLRMWDGSIQDYEMILAARDAQIHDTIVRRPDAYQSGVSEGGKDFSGGQKQCMEIARVLAQEPTLLVLDEATSALDAKTEYDVMEAVKDRGITCVIIAHRLSTIRDCDEIIVLDHGKVVERGTHEKLCALGGVYAGLIASD